MEQFAIFSNLPNGLIVEFEDKAVMVGGNCYSHQLWQLVTLNADGSIGTIYPPQDDEDEKAVEKAKLAVGKLENMVREALNGVYEGGIERTFRYAKVIGVPTGCWV